MPDSDRSPAPILVALDPELPGEGAERLARTLADAHGTGVVLATVFPLIDLHTRVSARHFERVLREEADRFLAGRAERWRAESPDIAVDTRTIGSPSAAHGLHRLARESGAAMVVVGPSRRHGAGLTFPGPMAMRFAHAAPCPVVVAAGRIPEHLDRIGAGFVPADDGRAALRVAAALAERCGATLRAISVAGALPWMDVIQPEFEGATLPKLFAGHLAFELAQAVDGLPAGLTVEADTLVGNPVEVLAEASAELDLLVCGSRGHGPLGEVVLGSTSHDLLEAAQCPVLLVPRAGRRADEPPQARESQSRSLSA
ncbi:MAG TPA: universal stress protein [Solirubrobacteraceae bacterium]|nr:universal stress protein [Solirubrobacteraceae bacterium]